MTNNTCVGILNRFRIIGDAANELPCDRRIKNSWGAEARVDRLLPKAAH